MLRRLTSTLLFCSYLLGTGPEQAQCGAAQAAKHRGHHGGGVVNRAELTLVRDPIKVRAAFPLATTVRCLPPLLPSASASSLSSTRPTTGGSTTSARGRAWQRRAPTGCRPGRDRWRSTASTTRASSADGFGSCHLPCLRKPLRQPAWRPARHQAAPTCRPGARRLGRRGSSPRPQQLASAAP